MSCAVRPPKDKTVLYSHNVIQDIYASSQYEDINEELWDHRLITSNKQNRKNLIRCKQ